jgi:hypothetical protein
MLLLRLLCLWGVPKSPRDRLFGDLRGSWSGEIAFSPSDDFSSTDSGRYSLDFSLSQDKTTLTGTFTNSLSTFSFLAQPDFNASDGVNLLSHVADNLGRLSIQSPDNDHAFLIRGLVAPENNQITIAIERAHLTVAVTDQFSSNVTVMAFGRTGRTQQIIKYIKIGLLLAMVGLFLDRLYHIGNLADVVKPEEAQYTTSIRAVKSQGTKQQQQKKDKRRPAKKKTE